MAIDKSSKLHRTNTTGGATSTTGPVKSAPKYRLIFRDLKQAIDTGLLRPDDRLQTEAELGVVYGASRITVAKAVNELMQQGLVSRRAGSGTHVCCVRRARRGMCSVCLSPTWAALRFSSRFAKP